jgi:hypothetical protein
MSSLPALILVLGALLVCAIVGIGVTQQRRDVSRETKRRRAF